MCMSCGFRESAPVKCYCLSLCLGNSWAKLCIVTILTKVHIFLLMLRSMLMLAIVRHHGRVAHGDMPVTHAEAGS